MTTDTSQPQNGLWLCSGEELELAIQAYGQAFAVTDWTTANAEHFLELKPELVRGSPTKKHIDEVLMRNGVVQINTKETMAMILSTLGHDYIFKTPDDIEALYLYRDGIYVTADTTVKGRIERILDHKANSHFCYEVVEHFKRRSYVPRSIFNNFDGLIPIENGLLDLRTLELVPYDPTKVFTFKIGTKFDATADCPKFKAFLNQVLPIIDEQCLVQEYAGYTLLPSFPHHKFMVFVGGGRNGKGALIRTLQGILGKENVTSIRLEQLDGNYRFAVANLYGALMNVCSEPSTRQPFATELLKQITGQDTLDAEMKNKQKPLKFTSFAKFFIQANHLPIVNDTTLSFWDRVLILEFKETFTDEKGNRLEDVEKTWLEDEEERSGILNWMIAGLKRLTENSRFTHTKSQDEMILVFKQASDPMGAFLTDPKECIYGPNLYTTRDNLYNRYKEYVENLGLEIEPPRRFADRIRRLAGVVDRRKRVQGTNERVWKGIGLVAKEPVVEEFDLLDVTGTDGTLGTHVPYPENSARSDNHTHTEECKTHVPSVPCAPADGKSSDKGVVFALSEDREERWFDLTRRAKAAGTNKLTHEVLDKIYSASELGLIGRDLLEWERAGRVCRILQEKESHWLIMEGSM